MKGRGRARGAVLAVLLAWAGPAGAQAIPAQPEAGGFRMGIQPWLGYGLWHVAAAKGLFRAEGLPDVEIETFAQDREIKEALAGGRLDGASVATHTALVLAAAGVPIRIVALLDVSMTADAIIAGPGIGAVADLRGRAVAYEEGSTSHMLLSYALARNGMSLADIVSVPMPALDAATAVTVDRTPAAVTYEPYLSLARLVDPRVKVLYTAAEDPGLISDVFVVRREVLEQRPGQVAALLRAWQAAHDDYEKDMAGGRAIIARAVQATPERLSTAFDGITFYSLPDNKIQLTGAFAQHVIADVERAARAAGLLPGDVDTAGLIDPRFVAAVTQ
ncbi:ABC transporter substrate-binding protein [Inquilinus limosus]|uniref:ABC transporter substrate-binding protein n=1 Tax=Inquilinus limosus TaxID=171674 RepID=A0A211ZKJ9_9PROT|nr:ABC transporter substrate-binding protein [Inquilinus limosus]OWJ65789.1 ABC transporter substrate-binding protein [Inquilinus limosus]